MNSNLEGKKTMRGSFKVFLVIFLSFFIQTACQNNVVETRQPAHQFNENEIYKEVVSELYPDGKAFLVFYWTKALHLNEAEISNLRSKGLDEETLTDFMAKNKERSQLNSDLELHGQVIFTTPQKLRNDFPIDDPQYLLEVDPEALRTFYPEVYGILEFSRVGTNSEVNQALVEITFYDIPGSGCDEHHLILLTMHDNLWEIKGTTKTVICG